MQSVVTMTLVGAAVLIFSGFSVALENTQPLTVSKRCMEDTNAFLWEINQTRPKEYAVQMYDAFGKMGSNVEGGNANQPGSVLQCRSAHGPTFSGQYCQVFLMQGTLQYFVGICVPDSCTEEDVEMLTLYGQLRFGLQSLIPPLPSILVNQSAQEMIMTHCLSNAITPDALDVTCLFVCCVMVTLPLAATLFTAITRWQRSREVSPSAESSCLNTGLNVYGSLKISGSRSEPNSISEESRDANSNTPQCFPQRWWHRCLEAFSLQTTSKGIFSTSSSIPGGGYSSLNGIRVLSLLWIMCGHSTQFPAINNLDNYKNWKKTVEHNPLYVLSISGPVFLAVDTFLLLGGLLSSRSLLGSIDGADNNLSPGVVANYLFRRIKRIQPLHLFIMCLTISVISLVHWGPYWFPFIDALMDFMAVVTGLAYVLRDTPAHPSAPHALYQGLHRPLWALAVTWIILACEEGYGGFIKTLLSLGFWVPLSNISFACYLIHPVFIILYMGLQETPIHYSDINFMYLFLGHLLLTLAVSYVLTVLVERPYLRLRCSLHN
ncbi:uncharacterized protein V6R79_000090 [Siganus canaliculatus]